MSSYMGYVRRLSCMMSGWRFWRHFWHLDIHFHVSFRQKFWRQRIRGANQIFLDKKNVVFMPKCNCQKEYAWKRICNGSPFELKILSLGITVWHQEASLAMPNSYPHDIFNPHFTTIKDSYSIDWFEFPRQILERKKNNNSIMRKTVNYKFTFAIISPS